MQQQDEIDSDDLDLEVLQEDINTAELGYERFSSSYDPVGTIENSSYKLIENRLIIVHAAVETTMGITPESSASLIIDQLQKKE